MRASRAVAAGAAAGRAPGAPQAPAARQMGRMRIGIVLTRAFLSPGWPASPYDVEYDLRMERITATLRRRDPGEDSPRSWPARRVELPQPGGPGAPRAPRAPRDARRARRSWLSSPRWGDRALCVGCRCGRARAILQIQRSR